jgi:hypothetical protein
MGVIKIEIEKSKDAKAFSNDNIIHQKEFKEALEWIEKGLAIAKEFKVNSNNLVLKENAKNEVLHSYNTITILGSRGSGKTTFLKSIIKKYENPFANEKQNRVEIIEIIDPTLIEEKGHIFLTVISLINSLVNSKLTVVEGDLKNITEWEKTVNFLAAGLPSMDGVGGVLTNTDWQDPEYIMGRGLIAVNTAFNLEVHFRKFISEALRYLEKDVFLIAFDDIDVDFRKGYPVIEMLRKYFTTPQIITFLTGDLHLYSTAIRKQKWGNFGKALLINEGQHLNRMQRYDEMVTELESQYLLKVLKPERRIHLTTMYEKTREFKQLKSTSKNEDAELGIFVNIKSNSNESQDEFIEIEKLYIELLSEFGIRNTYQVETYTSFLLALPVRTQIQFLNEYNKNTKNIHKINVFDSFLSDLLQKRVDTNLLNSSPKLLNSEILKLLLNEKELAEVYQLQPTTTDASLNASLLSLSLFSSIKIAENPFLIFDYLIKIGFVRNLLSNIPYSSDDKVLSSISSIEDFCKHSTVFQDKVLRDVSGSMNSYLIGVFSDNRPKAGFIPLPALAITSKKGIEPSANKIDRVFSNKAVSKIKEIIGFIPLSISASSNSKQSTATYSIYTVISTIGELIRKSELQDLNRGLIELSQIRTYLIPKFESGYKTSGGSYNFG